MKFRLVVGLLVLLRRAPHGARGLKCEGDEINGTLQAVAPRMGRVD